MLYRARDLKAIFQLIPQHTVEQALVKNMPLMKSLNFSRVLAGLRGLSVYETMTPQVKQATIKSLLNHMANCDKSDRNLIAILMRE